MPFTCGQQSSWDDAHLLCQETDGEGNEVFENTRKINLPERRWPGSISRCLLVWTTIATCYAVLMTTALIRQMANSRYTGPELIYSKLHQYLRTVPS